MAHDMLIEVAINNITIAVVSELFNKMEGRFFNFISPYIKDKTKVYTTAIADASVAVNTPTTIPPITTTKSIKLGNAARNFVPSSLALVGSPGLRLCFLIKIAAVIIKNNPISKPGIYPAINKAAMDTPPLAKE